MTESQAIRGIIILEKHLAEYGESAIAKAMLQKFYEELEELKNERK